MRRAYLVDAELEDDVDEVGVLEDAVELDDVLVVQRLVDLDLGEQLRRERGTFCLALFFCREILSMTFIAQYFLVSRFTPS